MDAAKTLIQNRLESVGWQTEQISSRVNLSAFKIRLWQELTVLE